MQRTLGVETSPAGTDAMTKPLGRRQLSVGDYAEGVRAGDRGVLSRAITLVESVRAEHRRQAQALLLGRMCAVTLGDLSRDFHARFAAQATHATLETAHG